MVISKSGDGYMLADFSFIFWAKAGAAPRVRTRTAVNNNKGNLRTIFFLLFCCRIRGLIKLSRVPDLKIRLTLLAAKLQTASRPTLSPSGQKTRPSKRFCFQGSDFVAILNRRNLGQTAPP
jgi:hypothetical protein